MGDKSKIEWCDATWNVVTGCTKVSQGCKHCYAIRASARLQAMGMRGYEGVVKDGAWTGRVNVVEEALLIPLRWKRPRVVFVNSMGDLFHEAVPEAFLDRVFGVMAACEQHTFVVLTKRPERMCQYLKERPHRELEDLGWLRATPGHTPVMLRYRGLKVDGLALRNLVIGVSVENQATADMRLPWLLAAPSWRRVVSCEPLLGPVRLDRVCGVGGMYYHALAGKIGVIAGGESGPDARPMHPAWARSLRYQCALAGVPFFFKQWGEWAETQCEPGGDLGGDVRRDTVRIVKGEGQNDGHFRRGDVFMRRVGKQAAGRLLDGRTHDALCWDPASLRYAVASPAS